MGIYTGTTRVTLNVGDVIVAANGSVMDVKAVGDTVRLTTRGDMPLSSEMPMCDIQSRFRTGMYRRIPGTVNVGDKGTWRSVFRRKDGRKAVQVGMFEIIATHAKRGVLVSFITNRPALWVSRREFSAMAVSGEIRVG